CIKGATVKPDTDRAAELLPEPNCFPVLSQSLCPGDGLRGVSKSNTIGIAKVKPDRTAEFLRYPARHCIQRIEDTLYGGTGGLGIKHRAETLEVGKQDVGVGDYSRAMTLLDTVN